jgi:urocanate hydratase
VLHGIFHDGGGVASVMPFMQGRPWPTALLKLKTSQRFSEMIHGIIRHADAGYETAIEVAKTKGVKLPMINMHGNR